MKTDLPQKLNAQLVAKNLDLSTFKRGETTEQKKELTAYFSSLVSLGIAEKIGENLFQATANPDNLMKIGEGVGSAVIGDHGIKKQAEFIKHGFIGITPMLLFQSMSVITGQYYLHNINENLKALGSKVEKLIFYHKDKDISMLKATFKMVEKLFLKTVYDNHEYGLVLNKTQDIKILREFCNNKINSSRAYLITLNEKFKVEDYKLQSEDITPKKPWYNIMPSDIISDLKAEERTQISLEKYVRDRSVMREMRKNDFEDIKPTKKLKSFEEKIKKIEIKYKDKIKNLEKTFRNAQDVRNKKTIEKRHKELAVILESTDLFYYLELKIMIDFVLVQLQFLKLKILLNLEKDDKNNYEMESLYSLISENNLSNLFTPQGKFINTFEDKILGFLNSTGQKIESPVVKRFVEIKKVFSEIQINIKGQEDSQINTQLYFTLKDDEASYTILSE